MTMHDADQPYLFVAPAPALATCLMTCNIQPDTPLSCLQAHCLLAVPAAQAACHSNFPQRKGRHGSGP